MPVRDGGARLARVLRAAREQETALRVELLVCDSGSTDGSPRVARAHGARVLTIAPARFGHGATRNLLAREARGAYVIFVTQDAVPATPHWLERLLDAFRREPDAGLAFGPYRAQPGASASTARELERFFASFGAGRTDRLG
ncbi:MAG: glycosyltransferase family A protein, partial [Solirubrobacteraceae bacterium]